MPKQIEVLAGPAIGPDGDRVEGGAPPLDTWPDWFLDDLREAGHLVKRTPPGTASTAAKKVTRSGTSQRARRSS